MLPRQDSPDAGDQPVRSTAEPGSNLTSSQGPVKEDNGPDRNEDSKARGPAAHERPPGERSGRASSSSVVDRDEAVAGGNGSSPRRRFLPGHPIAAMIGLTVLALCAAGGYVYW